MTATREMLLLIQPLQWIQRQYDTLFTHHGYNNNYHVTRAGTELKIH